MSEIDEEDQKKAKDNDSAAKAIVANWIWRAPELVELLGLLDEGYIQSGPTPKARRDRKAKVYWNGESTMPKVSIEPPVPDEPSVPSGLPKNWVREEALQKFSAVETKALNLKPNVDLKPAIEYLKTQLKRPTASTSS